MHKARAHAVCRACHDCVLLPPNQLRLWLPWLWLPWFWLPWLWLP